LVDGNFLLVQKGSHAKKRELLLHETLKDWTKFPTPNNAKQKEKIKFLISTIVCFPEERGWLLYQ